MTTPIPSIPPGASPEAASRIAAERLLELYRTSAARGVARDPLAGTVEMSFRARLLDALAQRAAARPAGAPPALPASPPAAIGGRLLSAEDAAAPAAPEAPEASASIPPRAPRGPAGTGREAEVIRRVAERSGVDRDFLTALRQIENGGPGREFGVLSVPAPTLDDQARIAAATVRRNVERFELRGGTAVDAATGRYTEEFVRFFSGRYAPIGAANDPTNLNRHHAGNLSRRYSQLIARV
jgi:hypothetical protein